MNTKTVLHTPGPWNLLQQNKKLFVQGRHQSYFSIAQVAGPSNSDASNELIANARLIALAPRMFESLKMLLDRMELINGCDKNCIHADPGLCPNHVAMDEARQIISEVEK